MRILITNDDGVYSPGLLALAEAAREFGEVRIYAPDVEMSSAAQSITAARPLSCKATLLPGVTAFRINGTPSDCVMLGTSLWDKVEVVLSGINIGANLGNAMWHSGTLAGARQAAMLGLRGFAFSAPSTEHAQPDFALLKPWAVTILRALLAAPELTLVNVNFPAQRPRGIQWTRQSVRHYDGKVVPAKDPMGRPHYWYTVTPLEAADQGTDRWAVENGYASMTPLGLDLTEHEQLAKVRELESWRALSFH